MGDSPSGETKMNTEKYNKKEYESMIDSIGDYLEKKCTLETDVALGVLAIIIKTLVNSGHLTAKEIERTITEFE